MFFIFKVIFLALQASFISFKLFFNIGIIDSEIHIIILISSVLILKILSGKHILFIVSAIPCNTCRFRVYNCYKMRLNAEKYENFGLLEDDRLNDFYCKDSKTCGNLKKGVL